MTNLQIHGYYVSKVPDLYVDHHGGATIESRHFRFIRFYADGFFAKYRRTKYDSTHEKVVTRRVAEYKEDPARYSNTIITVGKYNIDRHQVFIEASVAGKVVNEAFTIVSPDELLGEDLKEYEFKESKIG